jgi:hypothetical protein
MSKTKKEHLEKLRGKVHNYESFGRVIVEQILAKAAEEAKGSKNREIVL